MTPLTRSRFSNEQNIDELTAFLQDPINIYLSDDITSVSFHLSQKQNSIFFLLFRHSTMILKL